MGSVEKIHHADNTQEWRRYIHDSVMITQVLNTSGSVTATRTQFLLKDHLGSVNVITDGAGKITDLLAFGPWGKRRAESNWTSLSVSATQSTWFVGAKPRTSRGFTGHQMADEMEIIHMGGRIYDPLLGRFLQADPFVQSPSTTASLNRYSYVWNNPLNATDPSGFSLSSLWKEVRPFVGAIVGVVLAIYAPWAKEVWGPIVIGMISGAAGAAANGTSIFKGAMFGAFSGVAYAAGGVWGSAIWGGTETYMNGGAFGRGFVAAGIGAMGGAGGGGPSIKGFVTSAVLGGVATEVTGGKFKNGAASAAFMYAVSSGVGASRNANGSNSYAEQEGSEFYTVDKDGNKIQTTEQRERQLKHYGVKEGGLSRSETAEISTILAMDEFKAIESSVANAALECRCEPTALRVTEIEGVHFIDKIGAGTSGRRIEEIPKPLGFKSWRHVFDWHPHPGGTPVPSLNDLLTSQSQGTNNVIWYGEGNHRIYKGVSR